MGNPQSSIDPEWDLVEVPAGSFLMGLPYDQFWDDDGHSRPCNRVWLPEYRIQRTPVTVAQWMAFLQATGYDWPVLDQLPSHCPGKDYPVVLVSWYDAQAFIAWLQEETGLPYAIPTEAQWEKAARGTDGRLYAWGNEGDGVLEFLQREGRGPVGTHPALASPYGMLDAGQMVFEWCADRFDLHPYEITDPVGGRGPTVFMAGLDKYVEWTKRGGVPHRTESTGTVYRYGVHPATRRENQSFRVALNSANTLPAQGPALSLDFSHRGGVIGDSRICRLQMDAINDYAPMSLLDDDDFLTLPEFDGTPLGHRWPGYKKYFQGREVVFDGTPPGGFLQPPRVGFLHERKGDFAMLRPGAFATRKGDLMHIGVLQKEMEFLPIEVEGKTWYVNNVTNVVDCWDEEASECVYSPTGELVEMKRLAIKGEMVKDCYLFKMPPFHRTETFATERFIDLIAHCRYCGLLYNLKR